MLGLRAAIHADGTLEIAVGATGEATKGVMPCDGSGSPFVPGHKKLAFRVGLDPDGATTVRLIAKSARAART
jgi:hypothetical protein